MEAKEPSAEEILSKHIEKEAKLLKEKHEKEPKLSGEENQNNLFAETSLKQIEQLTKALEHCRKARKDAEDQLEELREEYKVLREDCKTITDKYNVLKTYKRIDFYKALREDVEKKEFRERKLKVNALLREKIDAFKMNLPQDEDRNDSDDESVLSSLLRGMKDRIIINRDFQKNLPTREIHILLEMMKLLARGIDDLDERMQYLEEE